MTATLYVTERDTQNERSVIERLTTRLQCQFAHFAYEASICDYIAIREGTAIALVEIKTRTTPHNNYPTYIIDQSKLDRLADTAQRLGLKPILVIWFTDDIYWINATKRPWPVKPGGRNDRNDSNDIDQVYHIPVAELKRL